MQKCWVLKATFHRAFDQVSDPFSSMEEIILLGFNRILTSGQKSTAIEGISLIKELVERSKGRIEIMAGGGIYNSNVDLLLKIREFMQYILVSMKKKLI